MAEFASASPVPPSALPLHGDALIARSVRFTLLLMAPLAVGAVFGAGASDFPTRCSPPSSPSCSTRGGPALPRLSTIAVAGATVLAGAVLGTLAAGNIVLIALAVAVAGFAYALIESMHPSAAAVGRFFCLSTSVCALMRRSGRSTWRLSPASSFTPGWSRSPGIWRLECGGPPPRPSFASSQSGWATAAASAGSSPSWSPQRSPASFLTGKMLGLDYPNWALLAVVIVLRADTDFSRHMIVNLMWGTLVGVAVSWTWIEFFRRRWRCRSVWRWWRQCAGRRSSCTARWAWARWPPSSYFSSSLSPSRPEELMRHTPVDRLADIALGCGFSLLAVWVNRGLQRRPAREG